MFRTVACLVACALLPLLVSAADPLPLPQRGVAEEPPFPASVVTAGGQRRRTGIVSESRSSSATEPCGDCT